MCGQRFVTRNMPHSCQVVALDEFFDGATPGLRELFELFVAAARENGPVTVNATKSRIGPPGPHAVRRDPAAAAKRYLLANFVLTRPIESLCGSRASSTMPPYYYVHRLRLAEAGRRRRRARRAGWPRPIQVGAQRHLSDPDWPRERS